MNISELTDDSLELLQIEGSFSLSWIACCRRCVFSIVFDPFVALGFVVDVFHSSSPRSASSPPETSSELDPQPLRSDLKKNGLG